MPKVVDHEQRRQELSAAVWRVIRRDGLEGASVRAVAREADCSAGSLRHYFATQSDLLSTAMREAVARIEARLGDFRSGEDAPDRVESVLHELLPLDAQRRAENEVWIAFSARALVDSDLRVLWRHVHAGLRAVCTWAIETIDTVGGRPHLDAPLEAARLHALIDGLALQAALASRPSAASVKECLAHHLEDLGRRP